MDSNIAAYIALNTINLTLMLLMAACVIALTITSKSKMLTSFNLFFFGMIVGWIIAIISDMLWLIFKLPFQITDFLGYAGTGLTLNAYTNLINIRTKALAETVFPWFIKPSMYLSRLFLVVSVVPVILSFAVFFVHNDSTIFYLNEISHYFNVASGGLILIFDITCVVLFWKLRQMIRNHNITDIQFKVIGKMGLYSSGCVFVALVLFASFVATGISYALIICRTFGALGAFFLLYMKWLLGTQKTKPQSALTSRPQLTSKVSTSLLPSIQSSPAMVTKFSHDSLIKHVK